MDENQLSTLSTKSTLSTFFFQSDKSVALARCWFRKHQRSNEEHTIGGTDDNAWLAALYDAHAAGVYGYAHAILADRAEAEDVVQEVFLRALARSRWWFGLRNPVGYLYRAARNEALSRLRKGGVRSRAATELSYAAELLVPVESSLESADEAARVNAALLELPVEQREVVVLKVYQNMTFKEIASVTGTSQNTVASRYRYGLAKLKDILEAEEAVSYGAN